MEYVIFFIRNLFRGGFFAVFLFKYFIQNRFLYHSSDSYVSEDAWIVPRNVAIDIDSQTLQPLRKI